MITPITRKELYLAKIIGEDVDIPETAKTREELFFLKILDNFSKIPEPITREELFLAKISGQDVELPEPKTRLELFLAKAAGVEIETPTPITREEIFWSNYPVIVDFELEGIPPLTYKAKAGALKDYRIYGNTAGGESVGDLVAEGEHAGEYKVPVTVEGKNLFDGNTIPAYTSLNEPHRFSVDTDATAIMLETTILPSTVTINAANGNRCYVSYYNTYPSNRDAAELFIYVSQTLPQTITVNTSYKYIMIQVGFRATVSNIMLNEGSTPLPYEPYHAPVTTSIYLPEPIKMVGDEAEYIDYGEQKMHRIGADDIDVTLPALPVLSGTNTLTVGTEVQPSKVYIKGQKERD